MPNISQFASPPNASRAPRMAALVLGALVLALGALPEAAQAQANAPWTFVPIPGAKCRRGGDTGIAVRPGTDPTKLIITVQGGGACFSGTSCAVNPGEFGQAQFDALVTDGKLDGGLWDRSRSAMAKYTQVFIPYCTGDLHAGNRTAYVDGVWGLQRFVGYVNMGLYFDYIVQNLLPTGARPEVKLTGFSAGGYGALLNAPRLRDKLPTHVLMSMLNDSAPPFDTQLFQSCQQQRWHDTWGYKDTIIRDCGPTCRANDWMNPFFVQLLNEYPDVGFGLVTTTNDAVIQSFSGLFATFSCGFDPTEAQYRAGLLRLRDQMSSIRYWDRNVGTFFYPNSINHCFIQDRRYYDYWLNSNSVHLWAEAQLDRYYAPDWRAAFYYDVGP